MNKKSRRNFLIAGILSANFYDYCFSSSPSEYFSIDESMHNFPAIINGGNFNMKMAIYRLPSVEKMPLIILNHGVPLNKKLEIIHNHPRPLSQIKYFLKLGFAVAIPMRRGYGGSDGHPEAFSCDIFKTTQEEAKDIVCAIEYVHSLPYIESEATILIGVSAGALASLHAAESVGNKIKCVVNFSGGRRLSGDPAKECYPENLVTAFHELGAGLKKLNTLWIYSSQDKIFPPDLVKKCFESYLLAGGLGVFHDIPIYSGDAHELFSNISAFPLWTAIFEDFIGVGKIRMLNI